MTISLRCRGIARDGGVLIVGGKRGRGDYTRLLGHRLRMDLEERRVAAPWNRQAYGLVSTLFAEVLF